MKKTLLILISLLLSLSSLQSKDCYDYLVLSGAEQLEAYGMDTTQHWWAITRPYNTKFRMIINGEEMPVFNSVTVPTFSPDAYNWAYFGEDNSGWSLVTRDSIIEIVADEPGKISFSPDGSVMAYSFLTGSEETIQITGHNINDKEILTFNKSSAVFLSNKGDYAFAVSRNKRQTMNVNGSESIQSDYVEPYGFWHTGEFIYASSFAGYWNLLRGEDYISENHSSITQFTMDSHGTAAAWVAVNMGANSVQAYVLSDEYREVLVSNRMDNITSLVLHPEVPLISYVGMRRNIYNIFLNNTKYRANVENSLPQFSHDGEDLFFLGCNIDCFASINGEVFPLYKKYLINRSFAHKPLSKDFAYSTPTRLVVREIESKNIRTGRMVDATSQPRYNRFADRYEALGEIWGKLYMLTCE